MESIAVVGIGCRFPKAKNPEAFWQLLRNGVDTICEVPTERWDLDVFYEPQAATPGKMNTRWGGFLEQVDRFDPIFFGISPREAEHMDPQQRLVLEVAWEALENAGIIPETLVGSQTGVFVGITNGDYNKLLYKDAYQVGAYSATGTTQCIAANRLSYLLNLQGPSMAIDTACSSSLVAVHVACQSLRNGESNLCLVGGVNLVITPEPTVSCSQAQMMSPDGRCKAFDASANGYVRGEGCGVVVLKRLSDALREGDKIQAVIKGSAVNQDGLTNGLTAPNGPSQQAVIRQALKKAGVKPAQISYVEAHGTGTSLGDPIEVKSLKAVLMEGRDTDSPCWIGSVKTNIGHLESAAGIAGLIKVVLSLQHKEIPPHLHLKQLNPYIKIKNTPIQIPTELKPWQAVEEKRLAGVSSFGFGGTNAHVILEEAPTQVKSPQGYRSAYQKLKVKSKEFSERPCHLFTLSAKCEKALQELVQGYQEFLETNSTAAIADICFTANTGRSHFDHRLAIITSDQQELADQLAKISAGEEVNGVFSGQLPGNNQSPQIAFLFTGQGSQYVNMGRQLYETQPVFRQTLDQCEQILQSYLKKSILDVIYPENTQQYLRQKENRKTQEINSSVIDQTAYTQPALFVIEYALAQLWQSWGIKPDIVMGHSVGEYVAATVAGVLSLEDSLKLIAHRGRLMQQLASGGEMIALMASESKVNQLIAPYREQVSLAAINGPQSTVISGAAAAIGTLRYSLEAEGIKTKQLQVSHAFHSPLMKPMLAEFEAIANQITYHQPRISLISNVTGTRADESIATASYWVNHVRQPVKFAQSMETLHQEGYQVFLEIGAKPILLGMGRQCLPEEVGVWLPSLRSGQEDWQQVLQSLAELYVQGVKVDWSGFDRDYPRSKVVLPNYPFQRQRYWIETDNPTYQKQSLSDHKTLHPLLGQRLHLAGLEEQIRFECQINASQPAYLKHHCVFSQPVFPGVGYLEIALAAGATLFNCENLILEDVVIQQALMLPEDEIKTIQVILTPQEGPTYSFEIFSLDMDSSESEPRWTAHAQGKLLAGDRDAELETMDLKTLKQEYHQQISVQDFYQEFRDRGIDYGSSFQSVHQLWHSEGKALGQIQLPETLVKEATKYQLHPVLLDASFQTLAAALDGTENQDTYLPINIKRLQVYRPASNYLWTQAEIGVITAHTQTLTGEVRLLDEQGMIVAQVEGLTLLRTSRSALLSTIEPDINSWLYQIHWQPQSISPDKQSIDLTKPGSWLLFAPATGIGQHLAESLKQQGQHSILVTPGENYQQLESQHYQINPINGSEFPRLLQESLEQQPPLRGIVHLWSLQSTIAPPKSAQELNKSQELGCGSVFHLVQALIKNQELKSPPTLWLVTQGSQSVANEPLPVQFPQAPLWGLGRVIAQEHGELQCRCLDLDPTVEDYLAVPALLQELLSPGDENQIAYRQEVRYVARLERQQKALTPTQGGLDIPSQQPFQLKLSEYGLLDNLMLQPMERRAPGSQEVEIQVKAVGLNFRDVLNALGLLKDYYAEYLGITSAEQLTFGFECAGTIVAVGEGVSHLQVGDEVMATMLTDAFSSFVTTRAEVVVPKPQPISPVEAATISLAFLTAYYGLQHLAQIQPGERVLIHAAAGGVGQAAVQLAQQAGAEIFATASPSKWEFLQSMGVQHVMNSRTLDFAEQVMDLTQGQGVDLVFNSLNGEFITKSFEALATGGRFVEIGKIGIWAQNQVQQKRPDAQYFPFDLGEVAQKNPGLITQIMDSLGQQFEQGYLKPLPHKVFPLQQVVEAFRYMQQSKHIGKVVISMPQADDKPVSIQPEGSYLITGGLGTLGLHSARWMAEQGARHLVLTGRRQPSDLAQQTIEQLQEGGAQVLVLCGDISQAEDVARIIEKIEGSLPPLRGVIHAAGVLDDGLLSNMSWTEFTRVMAPKVQGAWHLHSLTQNLPLDFFVCFSSMASLLGSAGQGNYAAANAFMDGLAHHRRGMSLPGLSINWGPWAEGGMAASLGSQHQNRLLRQGMSPITPEQGFHVLGDLLAQDSTQVGVLPINWPKFLKQLPIGTKMPLLEAFTSTVGQSRKGKSDFMQRLEATPVAERREFLVSHIRQQVSRVLGLTVAEQIGLRQSLFDLGIDSLMAVELKNQLESSLGHSIRSTVLFDYPTLEALVDYLEIDVLSTEFSVRSDSELQAAEQEAYSSDQLKDQLKEMSQDEISNLLAQKLANLKGGNKQ